LLAGWCGAERWVCGASYCSTIMNFDDGGD
jgi:hypothetical protein